MKDSGILCTILCDMGSHNLRQVFDLLDRIGVFRQGRIIASLETRQTHPEQIVGLITGAIGLVRLTREPVPAT